jgi:Mg2+ and Co2+ transporter CorA
MNPVTRQELQIQLQQTINTLLSKTFTRDEFLNFLQRVCTKQDAFTYIESARQKLLDKVTLPIGEQQILTQQIRIQYEEFAKILARLELKIDDLEKSVKTMQSKTETVINRNQPNPTKTVLEQLYA